MDGIELLLYDLRRYQAAVARIFERERDQKALLDHKGQQGRKRRQTGNAGSPISK